VARREDPWLRVLRVRVLAFGVVFGLAVAALFGRLWQLQVVEGAALYQRALHQSMRVVPIPAPRGEILDRNGLVLATDVPLFEATLGWTPRPPSPQEVSLLASILGIPPATVEAAAQRLQSGATLTPVVLRSGLTPRQYTLLVEDQAELPGVSIAALPVRRYPGIPGDRDPGPELAANLLGYVREGSVPGDVVGADGIEKSFNGPIHLPDGRTVLGLEGVDGAAYIEVDAAGHPVSQVRLQAPVPGDDVVLTIDAKLQAVAQRALRDQLQALRTRSFGSDGGPFPQAWAGAAVVIDVRTGAVLAAASEPTFDPNAFALDAIASPGSGIRQAFAAQYAAWLQEPGEPLLDHVVSDVAPPGSTFKPITAIAALEKGVITPSTHLPCPAAIPVGGGVLLHNWIPVYGGDLDLTEAIARSCDTFFYVVGAETGIAAIDRVAKAFGLGQLTGQDALYGEDPGQVSGPSVLPPGEGPWTPALTMQTAIGQGFTEVNPLQMADYTAALANGGTLWRPYFVKEILAPDGKVLYRYQPVVRARIPLSPSIVAAIHQAMGAVTQMNPSWWQDGIDADFGTGYWPFYLFSQETQQYLGRAITVAGKTGTAQTVPGQTPDGWWISWAPVNHPQIAVVVFIHHAGEGFASGAPVAREIYSYYFGLDKAMWEAGQASQIIPPAVQMYFGMPSQIPDWWPATPPTGQAG
jgi:penicillin-binding protein 2